MHEQTIICRQLFAGHMVCSRPMERKKKWIDLCSMVKKIFYNRKRKKERDNGGGVGLLLVPFILCTSGALSI